MTAGHLGFEQIVCSGGETRCFWQGGFLKSLERAMPLTPARIIGVSGGALSAACYVSATGERLKDVMMRRFEAQPSNVAWHDVVKGEGLTPHQRIYREVVTETLEGTSDAVASGPDFEVLLAHPPAFGGILGGRSGLRGRISEGFAALRLGRTQRRLHDAGRCTAGCA